MGIGEIYRLIADNGGVVSRRQLRAIDVSDSTIRRQVKRGVWEAEGRSALVAAGTKRDLATATRIIAVNHPSVVPTGVSAQCLIPDSPYSRLLKGKEVPWMIAPRDSASRWFAVGHPGAETVERSGIWVASDYCALVDLIRFLPRKQAHEAAMIALQQRRATVERLRRTAHQLVGHRGADQLRSIVHQASVGAQSHGEHRVIRLLKQAGISGWRANHAVTIAGRRYVLDIAFPALGVCIEFDGWAFHSDPQAFRRDRARQNGLVNAGWIVLRFTWADLDDGDALIAQVRAALQLRQAA